VRLRQRYPDNTGDRAGGSLATPRQRGLLAVPNRRRRLLALLCSATTKHNKNNIKNNNTNHAQNNHNNQQIRLAKAGCEETPPAFSNCEGVLSPSHLQSTGCLMDSTESDTAHESYSTGNPSPAEGERPLGWSPVDGVDPLVVLQQLLDLIETLRNIHVTLLRIEENVGCTP